MKSIYIVFNLCKCEKNYESLKIMKDIVSLGDRIEIYCDNKTLIYSNMAEEYDSLINLILYSYLIEKRTVMECFGIEFFCDTEKIFSLNFENETFEISDKYYKECIKIINEHFLDEKLYNQLYEIIKLDSKMDKNMIIRILAYFDYLRSIDVDQVIKLPNSDMDFSYSIYSLTMFKYYPKEIKDVFLELKKGNWSNENFFKVYYCNILIRFIIDLLDI